MLDIVIDENITGALEFFSGFGDIRAYHGREISREKVLDADVLIVRSVTNVNRELLEGTKVRFVGTATIGTDHIDTGFCRDAGIVFASAAGCNANSVKEYVFTAILSLLSRDKINPEGLTIGIIGAGNIGGKVWKAAENLGMRALVSDPPLFRKTGRYDYLSLKDFSECDIITFHVPLTFHGVDKTYRLMNEENIKKLKKGAIVINTSRGGVIDEQALMRQKNQLGLKIVTDVWENEPEINRVLVSISDIATPHIAGYSFEGKLSGTKIIYEALCKFRGITPPVAFTPPPVNNNKIFLNGNGNVVDDLYGAVSSAYDLARDDRNLREVIEKGGLPDGFDRLRKEYPIRREFGNYEVICKYKNDILIKKIEELGFRFSLKNNLDK